jgi:hypothetical protein
MYVQRLLLLLLDIHLRVVIASMKREMEDISQASHHSNPVTDGPITKGSKLRSDV